MHVTATVSLKLGDRVKSGRIRVTILPESNIAVVSLPLAFTGVTGEGPLSSPQQTVSNLQGRPVVNSPADADGIETSRLGQVHAMCPGSPHS